MLGWIRGKRFDLKTTVVLLLIAVAVWAVVSWARIKDFIPVEFRERGDSVAQLR